MYRICSLIIFGISVAGCYYPAPYYGDQIQNQNGGYSFKGDCRIPNYAQVVHYPMIHKLSELRVYDPPKHLNDFYYPVVVYSQLLLMNTIRNHKSVKVFAEGVAHTLVPEYLGRHGRLGVEIQNPEGKHVQVDADEVARAFRGEVSEDFNDLTKEQKHLLYQLGGGIISYILRITGTLYRTSTPEEEESVVASLENLYNKYRDVLQEIDSQKSPIDKEIIERRDELTKDIEHIIFDTREKYVKREVARYLKDNQDDLVIIGYGAAHDFSDEFKDYSFYTLPYTCSMPQYYLNNPNFALVLASKYGRLIEQSNVNLKTAEARLQQAVVILEKILFSDDSEDISFWNTSKGRPYNKSEIKQIIAQINQLVYSNSHVAFDSLSWMRIFSIKLRQ